ncbi:MAG: hypothetical protein ABI743_07755 [bacterium]
MQRSLVPLIALTVIVLAGCQAAATAPDPGPPTVPESAYAPANFQSGEHLSDVFTVHLDPELGTGTVTALEARSAQSQPPQAQSYDLDLTKFVSPTNLRVSAVTVLRNPNRCFLTLSFKHPFRAPDFSATTSAANRADLGFTGRVLILADQNHDSLNVPGDGLFQWDAEYMLNPDGYVATGDLLRQTGLTNNLFPYKLLVDEALDNRVGISNGGDPKGSYNAAAGGWQRANAGTPATGWTGYDYIHQGQEAAVTVQLDYTLLRTTAFTFNVALLAKYTDPRGTANRNFRFPFEPVDVAKFAYRLPYAAIDASNCAWCNTLDIMGSPTTTQVSAALRDWDTGANEAADATLGDEADVSLVQAGASDAPVIELVNPDLFPTPVAMTFDSGTGLPGDELQYSASFTNTANFAGEGWLFFRATDPEAADPAFSNYHYGVDPNTLVASAARAIKPRTYMPVKFHALNNSSWYARCTPANFSSSGYFSVTETPSGKLLIPVNVGGATNDLSTAPCLQSVPVGPHGTRTLMELDGQGHTTRHWAWLDDVATSSGAANQDAAGNTYYAFSFAAGDQNDGAVSMDLDPGPGTDVHSGRKTLVALVKFNPAGDYVWGRTFGEAYWQGSLGGWAFGAGVSYVVIGDNGQIYVSGGFTSQLDLDPGPGTYEVNADLASGSFFVTSFDAGGNWVWGWSGENGYDGCSIAKPAIRSNGDLAVAGYITRDTDFDPGPGTQIVIAGSRKTAFKAQFTPAGAPVNVTPWFESAPDTASVWVRDFATTSTDAEWVIGGYLGPVDLDPGPGTAIETTTGIASRVYFSRFNPAGTFTGYGILDTQSLTDGHTWFQGADVDSAGGLVIGGYVENGSSVDLDPGPATTLVTGATAEGELWWARLDPTGQLTWSHHAPNEAILYELLVLNGDRPLLYWTFFDVNQGFGSGPLGVTGNPFLVTLQSDGTW